MTEAVMEKTLFDFEAVFEVEDYLYFYGDALNAEVTERQVVFLVRELALEPPMQILDLACGFGRHANRLAALGHQVTGMDLTPGFLDIARREAQARQVQVVYCQGDMRHLAAVAAFDRVLLLFTALGYFSDEENLRVLQNVAAALRPGGLLIFDCLLQQAGLELHRAYGGWDAQPLSSESRRMILIARRP